MKKSKPKPKPKPKLKSKIEKSMLEKYRQMLLETQRTLVNHMQSMEKSVLQTPSRDASGDLTNLPTHIADLSTDTFHQNLTIELLESGEEVLKDVADALKRMDNGMYGICEECHKPIPPKRLDFIPYARLCVTCKSNEEKRNPRRIK